MALPFGKPKEMGVIIMKKHNLSMPQKLVAAAFAVLLASSGVVAIPATALAAETQSATDAVQQKLYGDSWRLLQIRARYNDSNNVLDHYDVTVGKDPDAEVVWKTGYNYNVDANVSSSSYVIDLSGKGYKLSPSALIRLCGQGTQKVVLAYVGDGYVRYGEGTLSHDQRSNSEVRCEYGVSTIKRIEFDKGEVTVYLERSTTDAYKDVEQAIDNIGEVTNTPECKARIEDARLAYYSLPRSEQGLVTNYLTYLNAVDAYSKLASKS